MKTYRFAQVRKDGENYRIDVYETMRPISGQCIKVVDVDRFLASAGVDEVMLDERPEKEVRSELDA